MSELLVLESDDEPLSEVAEDEVSEDPEPPSDDPEPLSLDVEVSSERSEDDDPDRLLA